MTIRCGCPNDGDETVFGPNHRCEVDPKPPADLPRFVPSSWFVVPRQDAPVTPPDPRYDENPIHRLLSPDELED
jgi:hypothetical protein